MKHLYLWLKAVVAAVAVMFASEASAQDGKFGFKVTPSCEKPVQSVAGVVAITFPSVENIFISNRKVALYDGDGNAVMKENGTEPMTYTLSVGDVPNEVKFTVSPALAADGEYRFVVAAGQLVDDDTDEKFPEISFTYTVSADAVGGGGWSVSPSLDQPLDKLEGEYTITLDDYEECGLLWGSLAKPCRVFVYQRGADTNLKPQTYFEASVVGNSNKIIFNAEPAFTMGGEWILNLSGFWQYETEVAIDDIDIPFTITGNAYTPDLPEEPKLPLDQTYTLNPDNTNPMTSLSGEIVITFPNISSFSDVGGLVSITSTNGLELTPDNGNRIRIRAHQAIDNAGVINLDQAGLRFTDNGEYTFSIPKKVFHVDGDQYEQDYVDPFTFTYIIDSTDGIAKRVAAEGGVYDVYGADGRTVMTGAKAAALGTLRPGMYIINGKNCIIR